MAGYVKWLQKCFDVVFNNIEESEASNKKEFEILEKEYQEINDEDKKELKNVFIYQFDSKDIIIVLSRLVIYTEIEDFKFALMYHILKGDFDCFTSAMLELQSIYYIDGYYEEKKYLHEKNVEKFNRELNMIYPYIPLQQRNRKRIVIMTEQILSLQHAPTRVVMEFAYALQKHLGYEVQIVTCPSNAEIPEEIWPKCAVVNAFEENHLLEYKGEVFKKHNINMFNRDIQEYNKLLLMIYLWKPYFVFSMGVMNPFVDVVDSFTTLVAMGMTTTMPLSTAKTLVLHGKCTREYIGERKYLSINKTFPISVEKVTECRMPEDYGLPNDKFLIAVVGNRLKLEIDQEFVDLMKTIIVNEEKVEFVFIGPSEGIENLFDEPIFEYKIHFLGYTNDLMGVYSVIDLYINPKRYGGGFSSSMAVQAGVPVVTMPDCDVAYNVGERFIVEDYTEMIEKIYRYINDVKYYNEQKEYTYTNLKGNVDEEVVNYVSSMIEGIENLMIE